MESLASTGITVPVLQLGLPDIFIDQGDPSQMLADCGLDKAGIIRSVRARLDEQLTHTFPALSGVIHAPVLFLSENSVMITMEFSHRGCSKYSDTRCIAINRAGIRAIRHPVKIADKSGKYNIRFHFQYVCKSTSSIQGAPICRGLWKYSTATMRNFRGIVRAYGAGHGDKARTESGAISK